MKWSDEEWEAYRRNCHRMLSLGGFRGELVCGELVYHWSLGRSPGEAAIAILNRVAEG